MKKAVKIVVSIIVILIICVAGFAGWFFYQLRDMRPLATAKISDSVFVVKGDIANLYLVKAGDGYIAFDAGDHPEKIAAGCKSLFIDPASVKALFLTHSDADHVDGLPAFPKATVYLSREEVPLLKDKAHRHFLGMGHMNKLPVSSYSTLSDGDVINVNGLAVHAVATPGHTRGSMSYRIGESLFTGDLCMIVDGQVRPMIGIFTEDMDRDAASIRKIASLSDIKRIYTAHAGYSTNLDQSMKPWR